MPQDSTADFLPLEIVPNVILEQRRNAAAFPLCPTATTASTLLPTTTTVTETLPNMTDRNAQPPAPPATPAARPDCPTLMKEHITWLNKNAMLGYAQAIAVAQAHDFLEEFWSPADKPKTASVLLAHPSHQTNAKEQFQKAKADEIKAEMAGQCTNGKVPDDLDLYHEVSASMWGLLDAKAIEEYEAMAAEANAHIAEPPSLANIYMNQSLIDQATVSLLERLIEFGPGQLGKVAWVAHCMYEDADGKVGHVNVKIHSKSWAVVPDNDLNSDEYVVAVVKWAARGFEGDKSTAPSEDQQTATAQAKSAIDKQGACSSKSSSSTSHKNKQLATAKAHQDSTVKLSNTIDDDEEDEADNDDEEDEEDKDDDNGDEDNDESVKVQAALANAATAKKCKEKAAKEAEERVAKEAEKSMEQEESEMATKEGEESKLAKGEEDKGSKGKEKGGQGKKRLAEEVAGEVALPPPSKRRGHPPKDTTDNSKPEPQRSARTGKGENHKNYKLVDGKYKGK
ncbi:hypothetical protein EV421DRAFT_1738956 [Armillaria borealis]|uniref:Uncharacterized protein n=1 Tax=Armillaria borealis TaxID=47425 RepID=A0AA39J866_9AGAR|nr:hypothetical protein EV421DRAFT_1738956 [Armillaria borealis]